MCGAGTVPARCSTTARSAASASHWMRSRVSRDGARTDRAGLPADREAPVARCSSKLRGMPWRHEVDKSRTARSTTTTRCSPKIPSVRTSSNRSGKPIDRPLTVAGPQIVSVTRWQRHAQTARQRRHVQSGNPLEIRGAAAVAGQTTQGFAAFGAAGFNSPSLLGLSLSAPYFHDGSAQTLEEVMSRHQLPQRRVNLRARSPTLIRRRTCRTCAAPARNR